MRTIIPLILLIAGCATSSAPDTRDLSGRLLLLPLDGTLRGLEGVGLRLVDGRRVVTGERGRFRFDGMPLTEFGILIEDPELRLAVASDARYRIYPCEPLDLRADIVVRRDPAPTGRPEPFFVDFAAPVRLQDRGDSHIAGQVVLPDGRPVPGVYVSVHEEDPEADGITLLRRLAQVSADRDGRFRAAGLPGERFAVRINPSSVGYFVSEGLRDVPEGADDVHLVVWRTWFESGARISGTVLGPDGTPVADARVVARPVGFRAEPPEARAGARGAFVVGGVKPGPWRLGVIIADRERATTGPVVCGETDIEIRIR